MIHRKTLAGSAVPVMLLPLLLVIHAIPVSAIEVHAPGQVERGTAFLVHLDSDAALSSLQTYVVSTDGIRVAGGGGFQTQTDGDLMIWVSLLGIPSTVPSGEYLLQAVATGKDGTVTSVERPLHIGPRAFASMRIALNQNLSDLRSIPDPRQVEEARRMISLVAVHNQTSVYNEGFFVIPVEGARETASFGDRRVFVYADGVEAQSIHFGIDLAAPVGTPVVSSGAGRVVFAADRIITGKSVVIEHLPGLFGLYYHLDSIAVSVGELVDRGQRIGTVGMTGLATGPHLHWEFRVGGASVDPERFLHQPVVDKDAIIRRIGNQ